MICFLVTERHRYTIDNYLQTWARGLSSQCRCVTYESLSLRRSLAGAAFVFTDLERLTPEQCGRLNTFSVLAEAAGGRVLNRPDRVLRRYDLLRTLHDRSLNPFNVYRADQPLDAVRFPVFLRHADEHEGPITGLLRDSGELSAALAPFRAGRVQRRELLVVEYVDTPATDGMFRKYAVMRVADRTVRRHVLFSTNWVGKLPDVVSPQALVEEYAFLGGHEHDEDVQRIFDVAGIDYGRIDYAVRDGHIVTWEINSNPTVMPLPEKCDPDRLAGQARSARAIGEALAALADRPPVTVRVPDDAKGIGKVYRRREKVVAAASRVWAGMVGLPGGKKLFTGLRRSLQLAADVESTRPEAKQPKRATRDR